jgi:hypothetical protein
MSDITLISCNECGVLLNKDVLQFDKKEVVWIDGGWEIAWCAVCPVCKNNVPGSKW